MCTVGGTLVVFVFLGMFFHDQGNLKILAPLLDRLSQLLLELIPPLTSGAAKGIRMQCGIDLYSLPWPRISPCWLTVSKRKAIK